MNTFSAFHQKPTQRTDRSVLRPSAPAIIAVTLAALMLTDPSVAQQVSAESCGSLANAFGPFDYRTDRGHSLQLVESAHFTPRVESLISGHTSSGPSGDLDYTLRAYPNHHRALVSIMKMTERAKTPTPRGLPRPAECYFERAVRWRVDDNVARMLYAQFLYLHKRPSEAAALLSTAAELGKESGLTQYNIGLVYLEAGAHEQALAQAHIAYAFGVARPQLRDQLKALGKWREPEPVAAAAPAAAAAAASEPAR